MYKKIPEDNLLEVRADVAKAMTSEVKMSITGYRQLSAEEQALINRVKAAAQQIADLVDDVRMIVGGNPLEQDTAVRLNPARWAALADTDFQVGFMKLTRAIARPTTY
jgi:hypothetical protein